MKKIIKKNYKFILGIVIGLIWSSGIAYAATILFDSDEVSYDNTSSGLSSTNVQDALDELYTKASNSSSQIVNIKNSDTSWNPSTIPENCVKTTATTLAKLNISTCEESNYFTRYYTYSGATEVNTYIYSSTPPTYDASSNNYSITASITKSGGCTDGQPKYYVSNSTCLSHLDASSSGETLVGSTACVKIGTGMLGFVYYTTSSYSGRRYYFEDNCGASNSQCHAYYSSTSDCGCYCHGSPASYASASTSAGLTFNKLKLCTLTADSPVTYASGVSCLFSKTLKSGDVPSGISLSTSSDCSSTISLPYTSNSNLTLYYCGSN